MDLRKKVLSFVLAFCLVCGAVLGMPSVNAQALEDVAQGEGESELLTNEAGEYAYRQTIQSVRARLAGGTDYLDKYGVTRKKVVNELTAHLNDNYYLGTPFIGGDHQSPRGDISYNGYAGTNCAGFVAYVLRKCGLDTAAVLQTMHKSPYYTGWGTGRKYDGLSAASNYMNLAQYGKLVAYAYPTAQELLASGKCERGDIVLRFWTDQWGGGADQDNHLMIFWGSTSGENLVWQNSLGRIHIGPMYMGTGYNYIVIKFAPEAPAPTPTPTPTPKPTPTPVPTVAGFKDVYEGDWYADEVSYVKEKGLMSGTDVDRFSPNEKVTRGQLAAILWRLAGKPESVAPSNFSDVDRNEYYYTAINWAAENQLVFGYDYGRFSPDRWLNRQEAAAILYRYARLRQMAGEPAGDLSAFKDTGQIDEYAVEPMRWALGVKLLSGNGNGTLDPKGWTSRAQMASILQRLDKLIT